VEPQKSNWPGTYLDGQSAARHPVTVAILTSGLRFTLEDGRTMLWPYEEIKQASGAHAGEHVRFEKGGELGESLTIPDGAFLGALEVYAPEARFHAPAGPGKTVAVALASVVGLVAAVAGVYVWGIPSLAGFAADRVPVSWEDKLGEIVVAQMVEESERLDDPVRQAAVERIVETLVPKGSSKYTYRVTLAKNDQVNAFAAPGGHLVIYTGLLSKTRKAEELAGVLAHEIQHVENRHVTRGMLRQAGFQLILTALTGDAGQLGQVLGAAGSLGVLGYQRGDEAEADREGMRLMQAARLDPTGMVGVFEILQEQDTDLPGVFEYLSSHPATDARLSEMKKLAKKAHYEPVALLPDVDWKAIRATP
jgi:predicted Zn-dependent protease